jgi:putative transposase
MIFSTKERRPRLRPDVQERVWALIGGAARAHKMSALQVGGYEDHIHALVLAPTTLSPSQIAQYLKGGSSKAIHEEIPALRSLSWQDGYGAFSVSKSNVPDVIRYIQDQDQHHQKKSFKEEYLEFLEKHGIEYDERYLWG